MRRHVIGLVLAGVGTFLMVCAVLLPTWVTGQVIKFPLNEYETATLAASNASYFDAGTLTEKTGVNLQATYTIKGVAAKGNSSTAVWNEYSYVYALVKLAGIVPGLDPDPSETAAKPPEAEQPPDPATR